MMEMTPVIKSMNHPKNDADVRQCLLIDIGAKKLLVPRVLVVEIIDYEGLDFKPGQGVEAGKFSWRGVDVPLLAESVIHSEQVDDPGKDSKVVIFHGVSRPQHLPFYALKTRRNPRLMNVSDKDVIQIGSMKTLNEAELMCVNVNAETAIIPKVHFLEKTIHEACTVNKQQASGI